MTKINYNYNGPLRVGIGGPVGSGKTTLLIELCREFKQNFEICAITNDIYTKEVKGALNDEVMKCIIFEFDSGRIRSKISPGNALYKTYIPTARNECTVYKSQPRNFKSGLRSILFWNRNLDATWFQIELDQTTGEVKKICGDSSKPGCNEGNTW